MSGITRLEYSERARKMSISSNYMFFLFDLTYFFLLLVWMCLCVVMQQDAKKELFLFWVLVCAIAVQIITFPILKEKAFYGRCSLVIGMIVVTAINFTYSGYLCLLLFLPISMLCLLKFDKYFAILIGIVSIINTILQLARMLYSPDTTTADYVSFCVVIFVGSMFALGLGMVNRIIGKNYQGAMLDLSRENRIHRKLYERSTLDTTTELLNRNAYNEYLEHFRNDEKQSICCIYIDVNGLHEYNNTYGHLEGDKMLNLVAETMRNSFTSQKQYRIGGDEFVVICENMIFRDVVLQLKEFKQKMKERKIHVATGMEWRDENIDIEDMIKAADTKMYQDKEKFYMTYPEGRNGAVIYERAVE